MMFEGPEYASYLALCRELRLERKYEAGDWHLQDFAGIRKGPWVWGHAPHKGEIPPGSVWLPRLDQWLEMLEKAGLAVVEVARVDDGYEATGRTATWDDEYAPGARPVTAPTREEAAAKLWLAVTGRTVPA